MNIYHDMTSHKLLTCKSYANHNEGAGKQVIVMNCTWLICILAGCLMFEGSFDNSDSSEIITIQSLIVRKPKNRAKTITL